MDSDDVQCVIAGLLLAAIVSVTIAIGVAVGANNKSWERYLTEKGVAEYRVDPVTGNTSFHLRNETQPVEE
jgi:hypothetical protein